MAHYDQPAAVAIVQIATIALLGGLFTRIVPGQLTDVSTVVIIFAAVQVAALGFVAELINKRVPNTYRN